MESGTVTVQAMPGVPTVLSPVPTVPLRILDVEPIDAGTFGSIFKGFIDPGRRQIALKKVLQNPNYKNRELDIQKLMNHVNVVALFYYFYVPSETVSHWHRSKNHAPILGVASAGFSDEFFSVRE